MPYRSAGAIRPVTEGELYGLSLLRVASWHALVFVGSAKMKTNVADLKEWAVSKLPLGPTLYPKVSCGACLIAQGKGRVT
eukprot:1161349-Pelagomonas_calceolata.AAC.5